MANPKVVLITGASSGIGAAIMTRLTKDGYKVFGTSRTPSAATPDGAALLSLDVCSDDSVRACVAEVLRRAGRIDVLIIVNMSSLAGLVSVPFQGFYNASKFAVEGYSESLRFELKPFGISVAMVEPAVIKTPLYSKPLPQAMPEYSPWRERALKTMKNFELKAPGPDAVASVVARVVREGLPPLRNKVTREAIVLPLLRRLLPDGAFESVVRTAFNLDKEGY